MSRAFVSRFSPNRTDPDDLERIFVQRHKLADTWLARLRDSILGEVKHHLLAVGPRGCGKSHLTTLLVNRLRKDKAILGKVRIARLPEDETTPSFWKFLLRILRALNAEYGEEFPPFPPPRLNQTSEDRRGDLLTGYLLEKLAGRTLLVVMENLDDVMRGLKPEGQKRWRAFLQEHPVAATLATAQQLTPDLSERTRPFFAFFQIEYLLPLTADEALDLLRRLAELAGNRELIDYLNTPAGRARVRAVRHITGGSHRVFIIMSEFVTRQALDNLVIAFEELLDELTPYYQERLRWLPDQQREIVEFLCRQVRTVPVKEIAASLYLSEQVAAAQLKQLKEKRYVVAATVKRESRYQLAEPMMRLCVEIKDPESEPIRLIVEFLRIWYERSEVTTRLECLPEDSALERRYFQAVLQIRPPDLPGPVEEALNQELEAARSSGDAQEVARVLVDLAMTADSSERCTAFASELGKLNRHTEAVTAWERAVQLSPLNALAWKHLGYELLETDRNAEALVASEKAINLNPNDSAPWNNKGGSLYYLGQYEDALTAVEHGIQIAPEDTIGWSNKGYCFLELHQYRSALDAFGQAVALNARSVSGWNGQGESLFHLGRFEEALASVDRAHGIDPQNPKVWTRKGLCLHALGRYEKALAAYDEALKAQPNWASTWKYRGRTYLALRRFADAASDFHHAIGLRGTEFDAIDSLVETCILTGNWAEAEKQLSSRFQLPDPTFKPQKSAYLPDCVTAVFRASSESEVWVSNVDRLARCASKAEQGWERSLGSLPTATGTATNSMPARPLALLANALVGSLSRPAYDEAPAETLTAWVSAWRKAAAKFPDLSLGVRLFETGIRYKQTKDSRVLLDLVQEERSILTDLFELDIDTEEVVEAASAPA